MLFNSFQFLVFFPLVTIAYFLLPPSGRRALLLIASWVFYMAFVPVYVLILLAIVLLDYVAALCIDRAAPRGKRIALAISIAGNVGLLGAFKYYPFITEQLTLVSSAFGGARRPSAADGSCPSVCRFTRFRP